MESIVKSPTDSTVVDALVKMGMQDMSFEAVVLRHPDVFSAEAVAKSQHSLDSLTSHASRAASAS
jgi:hypothetical protein